MNALLQTTTTSVLKHDPWQDFGTAYELSNADTDILKGEQPWELCDRTLTFLILRLHETLQSQDWENCEVALSILIRSDLMPVVDVAAKYGLGALAKRAMLSNRMDAPGAAGTVARFGRVLLVQVLALADTLED